MSGQEVFISGRRRVIAFCTLGVVTFGAVSTEGCASVLLVTERRAVAYVTDDAPERVEICSVLSGECAEAPSVRPGIYKVANARWAIATGLFVVEATNGGRLMTKIFDYRSKDVGPSGPWFVAIGGAIGLGSSVILKVLEIVGHYFSRRNDQIRSLRRALFELESELLAGKKIAGDDIIRKLASSGTDYVINEIIQARRVVRDYELNQITANEALRQLSIVRSGVGVLAGALRSWGHVNRA